MLALGRIAALLTSSMSLLVVVVVLILLLAAFIVAPILVVRVVGICVVITTMETVSSQSCRWDGRRNLRLIIVPISTLVAVFSVAFTIVVVILVLVLIIRVRITMLLMAVAVIVVSLLVARHGRVLEGRPANTRSARDGGGEEMKTGRSMRTAKTNRGGRRRRNVLRRE
jgi:hypothetical protein